MKNTRPDQTGKKQKTPTKSTRFRPGQSGNPQGRPKGSKNKVTLLAQTLLEGQAEALVQKLISKALSGNLTALRLCIERLLPPSRNHPVKFTLPNKIDAEGLVKTSALLLRHVAQGKLTPEEASRVSGLIEVHRNTLELEDIEKRLQALESNGDKQNE